MRATVAVAVMLVLPVLVAAQRFGRERFPQSGACFFEDANYRGDYFCIRAGDDVRAVPDGLNDEISSIRIFGRTEVVVFRDVRFGGGSTRFRSNVRNLKDEGWNDRVSSLRVQGESRDRDSGDRDRGDDRRDDRRYRGEDPDKIIRRAYQDVLGRDPDAGGLRQYRSRIIDDDWTEAQVRESLRSSPEYREKITMTRAKAAEIVRRAYQAVLKRDPDAAAEGYINRVFRDRWSQEDVERELRKSPEFRDRR